MEITPEIRQAVYAADCEEKGHIPDTSQLFAFVESSPLVVASPDETKLAHIRCTRCGRVWLVFDESGVDYDDAVQKVRVKLRDPALLKTRKQRQIEREREERDKARREEAERNRTSPIPTDGGTRLSGTRTPERSTTTISTSSTTKRVG